jgi:hypothetical protein
MISNSWIFSQKKNVKWISFVKKNLNFGLLSFNIQHSTSVSWFFLSFTFLPNKQQKVEKSHKKRRFQNGIKKGWNYDSLREFLKFFSILKSNMPHVKMLISPTTTFTYMQKSISMFFFFRSFRCCCCYLE